MVALPMLASHRRAVLLGLVLAVVALILGLLLPAESRAIECGAEWRYYSNSSYTHQVGAAGNRPQACGCTTYSWGQTTIYKQLGSTYCD